MKQFNKYILEAINKGIRLAIDDYEDIENNEPISSKQDIIKDEKSIKKLIEFNKQFVDLGLPSGTLWAKYNLGCDWNKLINNPNHSKPNDWYGNYYAWGETQPNKNEYNELNYKFSELCIKYNKDDGLAELQLEDDVAYQTNHKMKIPTKEQFEELLKYAINEWIKNYQRIEGLNGRLFTSKINGEQIFIPASGCNYPNQFDDDGSYCLLWSSSLYTGNPYYAWSLCSNSGSLNIYYDDRYYGFTVRPVLQVLQG